LFELGRRAGVSPLPGAAFGGTECVEMAEATDRLTRWDDPVLGELLWDERTLAWVGCVVVTGRTVRLVLDADRTNLSFGGAEVYD
jgi:hypothetical protein